MEDFIFPGDSQPNIEEPIRWEGSGESEPLSPHNIVPRVVEGLRLIKIELQNAPPMALARCELINNQEDKPFGGMFH